jgi:hypothetical protein
MKMKSTEETELFRKVACGNLAHEQLIVELSARHVHCLACARVYNRKYLTPEEAADLKRRFKTPVHYKQEVVFKKPKLMEDVPQDPEYDPDNEDFVDEEPL